MDSKDSLKKNKKKSKKGWRPGRFFLYDFVKFTGALPMLLLMRPKIHRVGKEKPPKGAYLVFANHSHPMDPIAMLIALPCRRPCVLATSALYRPRIGRWFFEHMHCIEVDKENFGIDSLHKIMGFLREGRVVGIFPEGHVHTHDDRVSVFKSGMVLMAQTAGVPVRPLYLAPPRSALGRWHFVYGDPIDVRALCGPRPTSEDLDRASRCIYERELALKAYYEEKYPKKNKEKQKGADAQAAPLPEKEEAIK